MEARHRPRLLLAAAGLFSLIAGARAQGQSWTDWPPARGIQDQLSAPLTTFSPGTSGALDIAYPAATIGSESVALQVLVAPQPRRFRVQAWTSRDWKGELIAESRVGGRVKTGTLEPLSFWGRNEVELLQLLGVDFDGSLPESLVVVAGGRRLCLLLPPATASTGEGSLIWGIVHGRHVSALGGSVQFRLGRDPPCFEAWFGTDRPGLCLDRPRTAVSVAVTQATDVYFPGSATLAGNTRTDSFRLTASEVFGRGETEVRIAVESELAVWRFDSPPPAARESTPDRGEQRGGPR